MGTGISIFSSRLSTLLPERIANAVIPLGLPTSSLPDLIHALVAHDMESLADVPGATPDIIQAAVTGMNSAYLGSFRNVWITAAALSGAGALSTWRSPLLLQSLLADPLLPAALCIKDIKENFNQQIDAPAESEEALYGEKVRPAV